MIANALATGNLLIGDGDNNFLTTNIVSEKSCSIEQVTQERSLFLPQDEGVERIISRDGFISAFLYNSDYMEVYSIASESTIEFGKYSPEVLETIKSTPSKQGDHKGERLRKAKPLEIEALSYETTLSPIYFDDALKAWHKILPWEEAFDEILYNELVKKNAVVK